MKRGVSTALALALASLLAAGTAQAAAPANDNFAAATPLGVGQEISGTNLDATAETGEPAPVSLAATRAPVCASVALDSKPICTSSVWYVFKAPQSIKYTIEVCDRGTDFDTILGVYDGTTIGSGPIGDDDDGCAGGGGTASGAITFDAIAGTEYHVDVNGYEGEQGSFYVRAYAGAQQARPQPDTVISRENSLAELRLAPIGLEGSGILSGPRMSPSFILDSTLIPSTFECSLDGAAFAACTSPVSYGGLEEGSSHTFAARATSGGQIDPTPIIQRFTVDTAPPETTILSGPSGELGSPEGEWEFANSEQRNRTQVFACSLDSQPSTGCSSPFKAQNLCEGPHTVSFAARDRAGNLDPTPVARKFEVTLGSQCETPSIGVPIPAFVHSTYVSEIQFDYDDEGAGGRVTFEYGTTSAYGEVGAAQTVGPSGPGGNSDYISLPNLKPSTTYHYKITLTTPFGAVSTGEQTVNTLSLGAGTIPVIENGTPVPSPHAALLPVTIDPEGPEVSYSAMIEETGPFTESSPRASSFEPLAASANPQPGSVSVADLKAGTTYRYRFVAQQSGAEGTEVWGPEGTFTTPTGDKAAGKPKVIVDKALRPRFRLRKGQVRFPSLTRKSKRLLLKVNGLPAKTRVTVKLMAGTSKQTARKKADAKGKARFKATLSKRIRKALLDKKVKRVTVKVTAQPPDESASSVTLTKKLKG